MIIRATAKLLNIARIKPVSIEEPTSIPLSGEWYTSLVSTGRKGGAAIHFLHNPSMITIIVVGRSLNKAVPLLPSKVISFLDRNKFPDLIPVFDLDSPPIICKTNSRSVLATMNDLKYNIEYHLSKSENLEPEDIDRIEDIHKEALIGGKIGRGGYITPLELLEEMRNI